MPDLHLMMPNNRSQYYARYRQRNIAEYSSARTYRKNIGVEINARQRKGRRRNVELSRLYRLHNENEYLENTLSDCIPPLWIGTFSERCAKCGAISFLMQHGKTVVTTVKIELASVSFPEALKIFCSTVILILLVLVKTFRLTILHL